MDKHRIGNDISYAIDLRQFIDRGWLKERVVYNPEDEDFENLDKGKDAFVHWKKELYTGWEFVDDNGDPIAFNPTSTPVSIRSILVYFINETLKKQIEERKAQKPRFVSRFPVEPYINAFDSNAYDICGCGMPGYRACPVPKRFVPYSGFGVYPCWDEIYRRPKKRVETAFLADTMATDKQNVVEARFPAYMQKYTGVYSMLVVAKIYAPGYGKNNLKTITIDFPNKFELVSKSADATSSDIIGSVQNTIDVLPEGEDTTPIVSRDIYVDGVGFDGDKIRLTRTDAENLDIDLNGIGAWYKPDEL